MCLSPILRYKRGIKISTGHFKVKEMPIQEVTNYHTRHNIPGLSGESGQRQNTSKSKEQNIFYGSYSTWCGAIELVYRALPVLFFFNFVLFFSQLK